MLTKSTAVLLLACGALFAAAQTQKTSEGKRVVKYGVPVVSGPMDSVLLKDYTPDSSLVVPATKVDKARFPVVDFHTHARMNNIKTAEDVRNWLKIMDEVGIQTSIVYTDAIGDDFEKVAALYRPYGKRFILYCAIDTRNIGAPDYPQRVVRELERCYRNGARGVGELSDKGWGMASGMGAVEGEFQKLPRNQRMHPDDRRLDAFWEKCAELKLPVSLHVADHPSCWQPLGPHQERTPDFQTFSLYGKDVPSYQELLDARNRAVAKHPHTTFVACHLGNQGNDLASLAKDLDRYPNLYVDIAARDYELGREPRTALKFLTKYKDRALFGTDMGNDREMYRAWWRLLETGDEYIPGRLWWRQYGLELPAPVLQAIYRDNAVRILNWKPME
jgi:predicted TIM-barrel fold metal-dependent hydrolase